MKVSLDNGSSIDIDGLLALLTPGIEKIIANKKETICFGPQVKFALLNQVFIDSE